MSEAGGDNVAPEHEQALDGMWQESLEAIQQIDSRKCFDTMIVLVDPDAAHA